MGKARTPKQPPEIGEQHAFETKRGAQCAIAVATRGSEAFVFVSTSDMNESLGLTHLELDNSFPALKSFDVFWGEIKPFSLATFFFESLVPIRFDPGRIICLNAVNRRR